MKGAGERFKRVYLRYGVLMQLKNVAMSALGSGGFSRGYARSLGGMTEIAGRVKG